MLKECNKTISCWIKHDIMYNMSMDDRAQTDDKYVVMELIEEWQLVQWKCLFKHIWSHVWIVYNAVSVIKSS